MNNDAVAIGIDTCGVGLSVSKHLVTLRHCGILLVANQPRCVVALKLEHDCKVVAQIVLRQRLTQFQTALILTASDTSHQVNLRLVPQIDVAHILRPVVPCRVWLTVRCGEVAIVFESVSFLHHLNLMTALWNTQREGTLAIGSDSLTQGVFHHPAIAQELYASYWDASAFIKHET